MFAQLPASPLQRINLPQLIEKGVELWLKRDDLLHPEVQGNKWRKLKYNLIDAKAKGYNQLLTFGGPFSNHIYATAAAAHLYGFKSVGVIRGYAAADLTPTLSFAKSKGMKLIFLTKAEYENRFSLDYEQIWKKELGEFYTLPEGGSSVLALRGVAEIIQEIDVEFDIICTACGTGGTLAGLAAELKSAQQALGFSALKGEGDLAERVNKLVENFSGKAAHNFIIFSDYHFGGYAKITTELIDFIQFFKQQTRVLLDPVYTGKMICGVFDLIQKDYFSRGTRIVAIHTGGLQGWDGYPKIYSQLVN